MGINYEKCNAFKMQEHKQFEGIMEDGMVAYGLAIDE